jgi:hypothetical protein
MRARLLCSLLLTAALVASSLSVPSSVSPVSAADGPSIRAFRGLGTWVDVYDYGPAFQSSAAALPAVTPANIDDMARLGVRTLYLQAAQDDTRSQGLIIDRALVGRMLRRAHRQGMKVVAWYLPHFGDVDRDLRYVRALYDFRSGGQRFDGLALDIEWTSDVKDTGKRNDALLSLARRARSLVRSVPLGAIVLEPVLLEDINTNYWPNFPWKKLRPSFDVWLPMSYWTNRSSDSGWKDAFRYTTENIRRVRANLDDRDAAVHPIGGIADGATPADLKAFTDAAKQRHAIGWSLYDYVTTTSSAWPRLHR